MVRWSSATGRGLERRYERSARSVPLAQRRSVDSVVGEEHDLSTRTFRALLTTMARTYLFFKPARLPLTTDELSEHTVLELEDADAIRASLDSVLEIEWLGPDCGRTVVDGHPLEFSVPAPGSGRSLALRCSLRADFSPTIQRLCDTLGWLAFDERPTCYQPHRPPMPA